MAIVCQKLPTLCQMTAHATGRTSSPPTITDVAPRGRRGPSTVSRAFTSPGRVNHRTREHVLAVAERLGYAPNPAAQALESGRTNTVALVVPDITNPYFSGVIKGAERAPPGAGSPSCWPTPRRTPPTRSSRPSAGPGRRRVRAGRVPAARRGSGAIAELQPGGAGQPGRPGMASVVADYDDGHPADRGPPGLARTPVVRLPGRAGRVLVGRPALGRAADAAASTGWRRRGSAPTSRPSRRARGRRRGARHGAHGGGAHNDMLAIGVLKRLAAAGRRGPRATSAWSGSTTSSARTSASRR